MIVTSIRPLRFQSIYATISRPLGQKAGGEIQIGLYKVMSNPPHYCKDRIAGYQDGCCSNEVHSGRVVIREFAINYEKRMDEHVNVEVLQYTINTDDAKGLSYTKC